MLEKICNPFSVFDISFTARNIFHMPGVDNDCIELRCFKDVVQRLPERSCAFHGEVSFHRNQIYGKASCQYYFTVRPFVRRTGQIVVQEEAKISFSIGLQAQS